MFVLPYDCSTKGRVAGMQRDETLQDWALWQTRGPTEGAVPVWLLWKLTPGFIYFAPPLEISEGRCVGLEQKSKTFADECNNKPHELRNNRTRVQE